MPFDPATHATLVVPCYNEQRRLPPYLASLCERLQPYPGVTVLVVDDGSDQAEFEAVRAVVEELRRRVKPQLAIDRLARHVGKGAALEHGFLAADTPLVGFVDADGSVGADDCLAVLAELAGAAGLEGAIASRVKMLGRTIVRRATRHALGRMFATLLVAAFEIPVYDSQCGCKFFRREAVLPLVPLIESKRWLWDTQLLILLHRRGARLREVPVSWAETSGSKLSRWHSLVTVPIELWTFKRMLARKGL